MQKEVYIIRGLPSEDYKVFKDRIFRLSENVLVKDGPKKMKICLTEKQPPRISIIPFKRAKIAVLSIDRHKGAVLKVITDTPGFAGGYAVEEAIPVSYTKSWEDGTPTPGENLLTLFHKKPGIDQDLQPECGTGGAH